MTNAIASLLPGQTLPLGSFGSVRTFAERSGDGKTVRFVRETSAGFVVFASQSWGVAVRAHYNAAGRELLSMGIDSPESYDVSARPGVSTPSLVAFLADGLNLRTDADVQRVITACIARADECREAAKQATDPRELRATAAWHLTQAVLLHRAARGMRRVVVDVSGETVSP